MRTQKLFSLLLAVLMLCSLSVSAFAAETDSEQSIKTASRRENSFFVLILTLPPSATGSILHHLIPIDLYENDANNQYFDTEPH